ncbi:MAG: universal stress protein A [Myxococcota bacterium]|jgi:universal stress protein A
MKSDIILVPMDYTGCAYEVAGFVSDIAGRLGAEVVLLHVVSMPLGVAEGTLIHPYDTLGDGIPLASYLDEDAYEHLKPLARVFEDAGCKVKVAVRHGEPAHAILQAADDLTVSMIAMGTHGRKGLRRLIEGSVAEAVIRQASCPVITVRTQNPTEHPGRTAAQFQAEAEALG